MELGVSSVSYQGNAFKDFSTNPVIGAKFTTFAAQTPKVDTVDVSTKKTPDIDDFYNKFQDKKNTKVYNPDLDVVLLKTKENNKVEYIISNSGGVKKLDPKTNDTTVIKDSDEDLAKYVSKMAKKEAKSENKTSLKDKFANVWKWFANLSTMTKATFKGLWYGMVGAAGTLGLAWVFTALPKAFAKQGPKLLDVMTKPLKFVPTSGKVIAGLVAASVLGYQLVVGKLNANRRTADIDHQLYAGHRDK